MDNFPLTYNSIPGPETNVLAIMTPKRPLKSITPQPYLFWLSNHYSRTYFKTGTDTDFQFVSLQHLNFEIQILLERDYQNDSIRITGYSVTHRCYLNTF